MEWIQLTYPQTIGIIVSGLGIYTALMIFIRLNGLRTLSKMSAHDFAVTIAIGSIVGAVISQETPSLGQGILAIGTLITLQCLYSVWRLYRSNSYLENQPLLLMEKGKILRENMTKARITENDLVAKLREANVLELKNVHAVILEATGDVSVLHGDGNLEDYLLRDVKRS